MKKEVAQKAAKWWADQLRGNAKLDNGDDSESGFFGMALGTILQDAEKKKRSPELVDKFEQELAKVLLEQKHFFTIGVDYHPDGLLVEASDRAGVELGMTSLPWKTTMWIKDDKVSVACGYRAQPEEI